MYNVYTIIQVVIYSYSRLFIDTKFIYQCNINIMHLKLDCQQKNYIFINLITMIILKFMFLFRTYSYINEILYFFIILCVKD